MIAIKYQASLFGDYKNTEYDKALIFYLMKEFRDKEMIPLSFQDNTSQYHKQALSLLNVDESWIIEFGTERIDIFHTNQDLLVTKFLSIEDFIKEVKRIVSIIEKIFKYKYHRMALISTNLFDRVKTEEQTKIYHKLSNTIDFYNELPVDEWSLQTVSRIEKQLVDQKEIFNAATQIGRARGEISINSSKSIIDTIELQIDINTFQGKTNIRFDILHVEMFLTEALRMHQEIKAQYKWKIEP